MEMMQNLLGTEEPNYIFMELFLRHMPPHVQTALANSTATEPRALAEEADCFFLATQRFSPEMLAATCSYSPPGAGVASSRGPIPTTAMLAQACATSTPVSVRNEEVRRPLQLRRVGKRQSPRSVAARKRQSPHSAAAVSVGSKGRLLFVKDTLSGRKFLCDTGAQRGVMMATAKDAAGETHGPPLLSGNGSPIRSYGIRTVDLWFGSQRFTWDFVTADVSFPLLGADFFGAHGLLVDVKRGRLVDALTFSTIACVRNEATYGGLSSSLSDGTKYQLLLGEFPGLTRPTFSSATTKHGVEHHIETKGPPIHARARRLDPEKLAVAKSEFANMECLGIVRRSHSPWASPLHIVPKPSGDREVTTAGLTTPLRPTATLFHTIRDSRPTWRAKSCSPRSTSWAGITRFPCNPSDVPKTAVITPFELFEFLRMPFGLKNGAQSFQRLMDSVLRDLPFVFVYLDYILVASSSEDEHLMHLCDLFARLDQQGLIINPAKSSSLGTSSTRTAPPPFRQRWRLSPLFPNLARLGAAGSSWGW
ncbi:uncharacterized protein LOC133507275 [Syngnathoides biaculeatus]|uniref:uncharacterized protein LOC133507275 n=1 Tax=Syngnathoides biaculeatus TaxID=300417 RepID=UPI002ADD37DF|nr:uncharacterized protein LOC133507275 [Syngnathoides biaculeatus]